MAALADLVAVAVGLLLVLFGALSLRLPWSWWRDRVIGSLGLLLLLWLLLPWSHPGTALALGPWGISEAGLQMAALLSCRLLALFGLIVLFLTTSPFERYVQALQSWRCPVLFVQLCLLTYRYLHVFHEELNHRRMALRVRGFRNRMSRHAYRTIGKVAGTLLVRGHDRSVRVAQAMQCRGFAGKVPQLKPFTFTRDDGYLAAGTLAAWTLVLLLPWRHAL